MSKKKKKKKKKEISNDTLYKQNLTNKKKKKRTTSRINPKKGMTISPMTMFVKNILFLILNFLTWPGIAQTRGLRSSPDGPRQINRMGLQC